ncbi:ATP-binding protein [Winogradskyella undariae]|uniref:ATP-binding protein n=1 Tax=Winogradskyella undariae TaxID=1285465 RepID=UPI001C5494F1|nr:ATP-binding protein [Winogradskyella undariae]
MKLTFYNKDEIINNLKKEEVVNVISEIIIDFPDYYPVLLKGGINLIGFEGKYFKIGYSHLLVDNPLLSDVEILKYKKFESSFSVNMSNCKNRGNNTSDFKLFITNNMDSYHTFLNLIEKNISSTKISSSIGLRPVEPYYNLENVVLNKEIMEDVNSSIFLIKNQEKIYNEWGFSKIDNKPKLILNFYGPPGTGKTMTAHSIANEFNKTILLVNYSDIESKYVGDAPKNLDEAFKVAKENNAVLFFDEADSFLGKRIGDVSSSSDQAINSLRSQMLILLEEFDGIVIFATNIVKNYDKAFESRILKHIKFDLPNKKERTEIIKSMLSISAPIEKKVFENDSLNELAGISEGFSGRVIKNAVLSSLVKAASLVNNEEISLNYFLEGFNETKLRIDNLEKETGIKRISEKFKKQIENKIKENLKN